jgi:iron-sulfur cluster assembly protein
MNSEAENLHQAPSGGPPGIPPSEWLAFTERAVEHVKREMAKVHPRPVGFRVGVTRTGCSGMAYVVDFVDDVSADDLLFRVDPELDVYVDRKSFGVIKGTRVDFARDGLNRLFQFKNPNVKSECGCGESFNV